MIAKRSAFRGSPVGLMVFSLILVGCAAATATSKPTAGQSISVSPTKEVPVSQGCNWYGEPRFTQTGIEPVKMASATTGWARGGRRTTDAGAHWLDVSPPALRQDAPADFAKRAKQPPGYLEFYLDGNHGWQVRSYSSAASPTAPCTFDHVLTFGTADGGRTWYQSQPIRAVSRAGSLYPQTVFFSDSVHGWLLFDTGPTLSTASRDHPKALDSTRQRMEAGTGSRSRIC
jgi:hypothetical protein